MSKNRIKNLIGFFMVLTFSLESMSQILPTKFLSAFDKIQVELIKYKSGELDISTLSQGSVRQLLFTTQTLAGLYTTKYLELETIRRESKRLEDSIGNFRKTIEQLDFARSKNASESVLARLENEKSTSMKRLIGLLEDDGWLNFENGRLVEMKSIIQAIKWSDDSLEKIDSFKMIADQITRVDQTEWDMTRLEGQGVHDLRKEMRWYKLQVSAMSDFIGTHDKSCGLGPITPVQAESGGRCLISSCLQQKVSQIYDVFGAIKDEGEGQDGLGQDIDQSLLKPAQDLYIEIKKNQLFKNLSSELNQCANSLTGASK